MRSNKILTAAMASLLALGACSGGGDNGDDADQSSGDQPSWGVSPATDELPMPEAGDRYDNPQDRDDIKDGGELKLPISELGPNFNQLSVDGGTLYVNHIMQWTAPQLWHSSVQGEREPNPDYLESVEQIDDDPETIKFVINPDAQWNNGDDITWEAFETNWKTQSGESDKYNPAATSGYSSIKSVEKGDDEKEAIVTFDEPYYPYESVFSTLEHPKNKDPEFYKEGWVNDLNPDLLAGPYTVDDLSKNELVLVPNPDWWGAKPKLDKIVYTQMEDTAEVNAFQNGEIDLASVGTSGRLKQVEDMDDVLLKRGFQTATNVFTMRKYGDLFDEKSGRKGFALGLDREKLAKVSFQGLDWDEDPPGSSLLYPWMDTYEDNLADMHHDTDEAEQVLQDAGWEMGDDGYRHKDGDTAEVDYVWFSDDDTAKAQARAVQKMEKEIGIKVNLDNRPASEFSNTLHETKDYDVIAMGWSGDDPAAWLDECQIYCSDSESNYSELGTDKIDEQLQKASAIKDTEEAAKVGNKAESAALHLFGLFPISNGPKQVVNKKGLANISAFTRGLAGFHSEPAENVGWMTDEALQQRDD